MDDKQLVIVSSIVIKTRDNNSLCKTNITI